MVMCLQTFGHFEYLSVILAIFWDAIDASQVSILGNVPQTAWKCSCWAVQVGQRMSRRTWNYNETERQKERDRIQEPGTFLSLSGNSVCACMNLCVHVCVCVRVCVCGVITARSPAWSPVEVSSVCLWHAVVLTFPLSSPLLSSGLVTLWLALAPPGAPPTPQHRSHTGASGTAGCPLCP